MFCAHFVSSYDSSDDVMCTHRIVVWFYWWCSVDTLHRRMILLLMFCAHIASRCDSTDDVLFTHRIVVWFYWRCSVHVSHWLYDSTDDVQCIHYIVLWFYWWCSGLTPTGLTIQQMITTRTMYQGYDSRKEFICSLGIRVMIPQMILWCTLHCSLWFRDHFM